MLAELDLSFLKMLWKWKLLSTSGIWKIQGNQDSLENTYYHLRKLEKAKLIKPISFKYGMCLWTLSKPGFALIQSEIPNLIIQGSASEHMIHDFWVTAFHIGDWAENRPAGLHLVSEQELRRVQLENLPPGTPNPEKHRSDGYWMNYRNSKSEPQIVALEVERSLKTETTYKKYFDFYDLEDSISCVIWPVSSKEISTRIWKVLNSGNIFRPEIHFIVTTKDFVNQGWNSRAQNIQGSALSVISLLTSKLLPTSIQVVSNSSFQNFLNLRKKPTISNASEAFRISPVPY